MHVVAPMPMIAVGLASFAVVPAYGRLALNLRSGLSPAEQKGNVSLDLESYADWSIDPLLDDEDGDAITQPLVNSTVVAAAEKGPWGTWPRVMILGAQKAATSSLWALLKKHPQLCAGHALPGEKGFRKKELHFFDRDYVYGVKHYLRHYSDLKCKRQQGMFMDATPAYLRQPEVPRRVAEVIPGKIRLQLRFVALLREPIARDLSYFNHEAFYAHKTGALRLSAHLNSKDEPYETYARRQLIRARTGQTNSLYYGEYDDQLGRWCKFFARKQFLVLNFEQLIGWQAESLQRITEFLGIKPFAPHIILPHENAQPFAGKVAMVTVPCKIRRKLADYFEPLNVKLYKRLHDDHERLIAPAQEPPFPLFTPSTC